MHFEIIELLIFSRNILAILTYILGNTVLKQKTLQDGLYNLGKTLQNACYNYRIMLHYLYHTTCGGGLMLRRKAYEKLLNWKN